MATERYEATGPDGSIRFSVDSADQTPLAVAARRALAAKRGVPESMISATFTRIDPTNDEARSIVPPLT